MNKILKVSFREKVAYSLGLVPDTYSLQNVNMLAMIVYNIILGVDPAIIGAILAISRIFDAFFDTAVGNFFDSTQWFGGLRKPFIAIGAVSTALSIQLIWMVPPDAPTWVMSIYFAVCLNIFYMCYSIYSVSYESLGADITPDYNERGKLFSFRELLRQPLSLGIPWMTAAIYWDVFESPLAGARAVGLVVGVIIAGLGIYTALFTRERAIQTTVAREKVNLLRTLLLLRSNMPFITLVSIASLCLLAFFFTISLGFYVCTYYLYSGDLKAAAILGGYSGTLNILGASIGAAISYLLTQRIDRLQLVRFSALTLLLTSALSWFTYTPNMPMLSLITHPINGAITAFFWVGLISMRADVCDWDECLVHRRRSGLITGAMSWLSKLGISIGIFLGGLAVSLTGFNLHLSPNDQVTIAKKLKILFVIVPSLIYLLVFILTLLYRLDRPKHNKISAILRAREQLNPA